MGKVFGAILGVFLLLGGFQASINDGINGWRTEDTTQSFAITTAAAQTTDNVTLTGDLYQDDVAQVIAITSNVTGESPVATTYTTATNVLLLSALDADTTHTLSVNYYAESDSEVMQVIGPFLGILIFGGLLFALAYSAFHKGHKR